MLFFQTKVDNHWRSSCANVYNGTHMGELVSGRSLRSRVPFKAPIIFYANTHTHTQGRISHAISIISGRLRINMQRRLMWKSLRRKLTAELPHSCHRFSNYRRLALRRDHLGEVRRWPLRGQTPLFSTHTHRQILLILLVLTPLFVLIISSSGIPEKTSGAHSALRSTGKEERSRRAVRLISKYREMRIPSELSICMTMSC